MVGHVFGELVAFVRNAGIVGQVEGLEVNVVGTGH